MKTINYSKKNQDIQDVLGYMTHITRRVTRHVTRHVARHVTLYLHCRSYIEKHTLVQNFNKRVTYRSSWSTSISISKLIIIFMTKK